jgi:predicted transcriptional regulator of viral defense system
MDYGYTKKNGIGGISRNKREILDFLNRKFTGPFRISDVMKLLSIPYGKATHLLAYWAATGWLTRIKKGLYSTVPLGTESPKLRVEDPWIVANEVFQPCFIGGWSACEHWGFTEQIFDSIVVFTSQRVRQSKVKIQQTTFILKFVSQKKSFGTKTIWRQQTKIKISDPARTIVDILNAPYIGGGMKHVAIIVANYFESESRDDDRLIDYMKQMKNKTLYKRLGYLIETLELDAGNLLKVCEKNISKGYSVFDPSILNKGKILRRWNLRINVQIDKKDVTL